MATRSATTQREQLRRALQSKLLRYLAAVGAVAAEIAEQVRLLDGLVRYRFGDNAELMGAWASARNVLGPFRSQVEPEPGKGETGGAGTGGGSDAVASAA